MKTSQVLRAARAKIEVPERWTKDAFARDATGFPVYPRHRNAACWDIYGALDVATDNEEARHQATGALTAVTMWGLAYWQDNLSGTHAQAHPEVLAAFDKAIAEREAVGD